MDCPLPGFTLADRAAVTYDSLDRVVAWKSEGDVAVLASRPVRLRWVLRGADVFSFRFEQTILRYWQETGARGMPCAYLVHPTRMN